MKTVLLIDDEQDCLDSLGAMMSHLGYQVIARKDAKTALATVLREGTTIDLVITDYSMPEINGLEFLILLKRTLPSVPMIMLTGYGDSDTYLKALGLGVFEFISKPVGIKELDRIIQAAIQSSNKSS
jgi:DNA-binding NtrC family response regulator